jgi:hypothetical protein
MLGILVRRSVDHNVFKIQIPAGFHDPQGDLAPIGYQNLFFQTDLGIGCGGRSQYRVKKPEQNAFAIRRARAKAGWRNACPGKGAWQHPCGQKEKKHSRTTGSAFSPSHIFYSQRRTNEKDEISLEENALRKIEKRILLKHHIFVWYSDAAFGTEWLARAKHGSYTDFGGKRQFFS